MTGFIRFFDSKIIKWFIIGTYTYFCLIILIEVIRRYIFGASSPWGEMTARYAFVYLTYVAAAEGIRQGGTFALICFRTASRRRPKSGLSCILMP